MITVLESLGVSTKTEMVYRAMLTHPDWGVTHIAVYLEISEELVRNSLDELAELALLRPSWDRPGQLQPVSPEVGLASLLARAEAEIAERLQQIETTRSAVAAIAAEHHANRERGQVIILNSLDQVRDRLAELARAAAGECVSLTPGAAQRPDTFLAGKSANQLALERGVRVRSIYQDSFRNDPATLAYVRWLTDQGGQTRSAPTLPIMMVIIDKSIALLPIDPTDSTRGAVEVHAPGVVAAAYALFEQVWATATPLDTPMRVTDANGLTPQESQLLKILSEGHTDEVAGRRLNVSLRTVRRMMSQLMQRLDAQSRFQAGIRAAAKGWLTDPKP